MSRRFWFHFWISGNELTADRNEKRNPEKLILKMLWAFTLRLNQQQAEGPRANKLSLSLQAKREVPVSDPDEEER